MTKTFEIEKNCIPYEVVVKYDCFARIDVTIYRIRRPKWKFFRTDFLPTESKGFFIEDFPTIEEGVNWTLECIFEKIGITDATSQKLKDYFD